MSKHEQIGQSDECYTPKYIFDALGVSFDLDVAHPKDSLTLVPTDRFITEDSLNKDWKGFIWCNPPFGGRNGLIPWIDKFCIHGNGIILTPDRTSAPWCQTLFKQTDGVLFIDGKVKFIKPDGTRGNSPSTGTCLFAIGSKGVDALRSAQKKGLGKFYYNL